MTRTTFSLPRSCPGTTVTLAGVAVIVLLLAACGDTAAPNATATTTTNGSTSAGRGFIATLIPLTEAPGTNTPPASTAAAPNTNTRAPGTNATVLPANTPGITGSPGSTTTTGPNTWTDPDGTISLQYPGTWRGTPAATSADDDLRLDGPNSQTMFVDIFAPDASGPAPTVDEALQLIRMAQGRSTQYSYTYGMIQDVMVGGQQAKYLEYQFTPKANQTAAAMKGAIWVVQRGDRTFVLRVSNISTNRADVDAIISSVMFPQAAPANTTATPTPRPGPMTPAPSGTGTAAGGTAAPMASAAASRAPAGTGTAAPPSAASPTRGMSSPMPTAPTAPTASAVGAAQVGPGTFTDPNGRMVFQFPQGWKFINPGGASSSFFEFDGPDGALIFVGINDSPGTLDDALSSYRESQQKSQIFTFMEASVMDVQIGGEPGKLVTYTYTPLSQPNDPPRTGAVWIVVRSGKQFDFDAQNIGTHRPDIDTMIATIRFTK